MNKIIALCLLVATTITQPTEQHITIHSEEIIGDRTAVYSTNINVEYMAKVANAEAGNQGDYGKRLVIDVMLNRIDSDKFPNTIEEIVKQPGQFEVYAFQMIERQEVTETDISRVYDEIYDRQRNDILYFREGHYHSFGTPVTYYKDHYFSR